jgi:hypothetical protein
VEPLPPFGVDFTLDAANWDAANWDAQLRAKAQAAAKPILPCFHMSPRALTCLWERVGRRWWDPFLGFPLGAGMHNGAQKAALCHEKAACAINDYHSCAAQNGNRGWVPRR